MTMLDQMRQHKNWLKWSLGLVILTFVVLYVPQFLRQQAVGAAPDDVLATVNGRCVKVSVAKMSSVAKATC